MEEGRWRQKTGLYWMCQSRVHGRRPGLNKVSQRGEFRQILKKKKKILFAFKRLHLPFQK